MIGWLRRTRREDTVEEAPDPRLVAWAEGVFAAESARTRSAGQASVTEQFTAQLPAVPEPRTEVLPRQFDMAEHRRRNGPFMPYDAVSPPPPMPGGA